MQNYYDQTSDHQPLGVRMRPDLQITTIHYQSEPWYVVKDPHGQQYFRLNEQEFAILSLLDGETSFFQLREKFEKDFSPCRVSFQELTSMIRELFKKSLIVSTGGGNALQLHEYAREKRRDQLIKRLRNPLAIQLRGWDPTAFIDLTYPLIGWFFSRWMVRLNLMFVLSAIVWLIYHHDQFLAQLPALSSFLSSDNLLLLGLVLISTKIVHELGHAWVHRRFDGECHEIGIMIFFFLPTLYCNTSDSWLFRDKWKRMAVGAAGVYVELFLFAVATYVWWFTQVDVVRAVALNVMVICSISAAVTNGNPLMRYDGYFVLSDWLEIPNLAKQSSGEIRRLFLNKCLGMEREVDLWNSGFNKTIFVAYGVASFLFRVLLITTISWVLIGRFQSVGLAAPGAVIAMISFVTLFLAPLKQVVTSFSQVSQRQQIRRGPLLVTAGTTAAVLTGIFLVPLPHYVHGDCTVQLAGPQSVYAPADARIDHVLVQPGEYVEAGQPLVQLASETLDERISELQLDIDELDVELQLLQRPRLLGARRRTGTQSLQTLRTSRDRLHAQLEILQQEQDSLLVSAPRAGFVFGNTVGRRQADTDDETLNRVSGNPLSPANLGAWLQRGEEICRIGTSEKPEVLLLVPHRHNSLVRNGQDVDILLDSHPQSLTGHIAAVSENESRMRDLPAPILVGSKSAAISYAKSSADQEKRKDMEQKDGQTLTSTMLQATVTLSQSENQVLNIASIGQGRVRVGRRTLWTRARTKIDELIQQAL